MQQQQQEMPQSRIFGQPPPPTQQQQQQQRGFGFGGAVPSPRGMPMAAGAAGPHLAVQQKQHTTTLAPPPPPQQQNQGSSSSARGMAAAAEQIAYEDAWKACNPDITTPFASVEDAISRYIRVLPLSRSISLLLHRSPVSPPSALKPSVHTISLDIAFSI